MLVTSSFRPVFKNPAVFAEFDNLFNNVADHLTKDLTATHPSVNIFENKEGFTLELAAPGLRKEDFQIQLDKRILKVSAKKEATSLPEGTKSWRKEFSFLNFERSFNLPDTIDAESIKANYEQGILTIHIAKRPTIAPKNIAIA